MSLVPNRKIFDLSVSTDCVFNVNVNKLCIVSFSC